MEEKSKTLAPLSLKDKSVCVYDNGLFIELAVKLVKDFKTVYYFCPWVAAYPKSSLSLIGKNVDGVERILEFEDIIAKCDMFVFPDVYTGSLQAQLRGLGKRVFGCGKGEEIELDRWGLKKRLKEIGLAVIHTERIVGLDALKARLKAVSNKFIKISKFRGDLETFHHKEWSSTSPWIDELAHNVGPRQQIMEFILEDWIPGIEIGYDGYTVDGRFAQTACFGYEIKDASYIGKVKKYNELPEALKMVNEKLGPWLKSVTYRGFFSTEIRIGANRVPYLTDPCARMGSPPGEVMLEMYQNLAEILWYGAEGTVIEPVMAAQYATELLIKSEWGKTNWLEIRFPKELRPWVKLRNLTKIGDSYYVVPQVVTSEVGAVVAIGKSMEEAIATVKKRAEAVKGYQIEFKPDSLDEAKAEINTGRRFGVNF